MKPFGIVMANWNKGQYIGQAIDSVLAQTDPDWILSIADDGSTDASLEEIGKRADPRIHLNRVPHGGPGAAYRAAAVTLFGLTDTWVAGPLDSDDTLLPDAVKLVRKAYSEHPDVGLVYTQNYRCDASLNKIEIGRCRRLPPDETILSLLNKGDPLRVSHWFTFTKEAYLRTEGFQVQDRHQDMDLVLRLEEVCKLYFLDEPLYNYRILDDGLHTGTRVADFAPLVRERAGIRRAASRFVP